MKRSLILTLALVLPATLFAQQAAPTAPAKPKQQPKQQKAPKPQKAKPQKPAAKPAAPQKLQVHSALIVPGEQSGNVERVFQFCLNQLSNSPDQPENFFYVGKASRYVELAKDGRNQFTETLIQCLKNSKVGWLKDIYRTQLVSQLQQSGSMDLARKYHAQRGLLVHWWKIGGFGQSSRSGLDRLFPVERDLASGQFDLTAKYQKVRKKIGWVSAFKNESPLESMANVGAGGSGVAYGVTQIEVAEAVEAWAEYSGPSVKFIVNRSPAVTINRMEEIYPQTLRFKVNLQKGWNRIVAKMIGGGSSFSLRLVDKNGDAIAFKSESEKTVHEVAAVKQDSTQAPANSWLHESFKAEGKKNSASQLVYGFFLQSEDDLEEPGLEIIEGLFKAEAKPSAQLTYFVGRCYQRAFHLPNAVRVAKSRSLFSKAAEMDEALSLAQQAIARFELSAGKIVEAIERLEKLLGGKVENLTTALDLYSILSRQNWTAEAEAILEQVFAKYKGYEFLRSLKLRQLSQDNRRDEIMALQKKWFNENLGRNWIARRLIRHELTMGNFDEAEKILATWKKREPWQTKTFMQVQMEIHEARGDKAKVLQSLRDLAAFEPENDRAEETLAEALVLTGEPKQVAEGLKIYDKILEKNPGRQDIREMKFQIADKKERFWSQWFVSNEQLLKMVPEKDKFPGVSKISLYDLEVMILHKDGSYDMAVQQAWLVCDDRGVQELGSRYPSGETINIQTILPNGEVLEPILTSGGSFEMPGLKPGVIVTHSYRRSSGKPGFQFEYGPWWFQDTSFREPYVLSRWVLSVEAGQEFEIIEKNMPNSAQVQEADGVKTYIWETRNVERLVPEKNMPPVEELLPHVRLYERRSLDDFIANYKDVTLGRSYVNDKIQAIADEVCKDKKTPFEKAEAIFRYVKETVLNNGGARTASEILTAKAGDPMTPIRALFRAAKVPYDDLLAAIDSPVTDSEKWLYPTEGMFRVGLLRVAEKQKDGRMKYAYVFPYGPKLMSFGFLPPELSGAKALYLGPNHTGFGTLPVVPVERQGEDLYVTINVQKDGSAKVAQNELSHGMRGFQIKEAVINIPRPRLENFIQRGVSNLFPGATVDSFDFPEAAKYGIPLKTTWAATVPKFVVTRGDGQLQCPNGLRPFNLLGTFGGRPNRKFDIVLGRTLVSRNTVTINFDHHIVPALPKSIYLNQSWGSYSLTFQRQGNSIVIERRLEMVPARISKEHYKQYLEFFEQIDTAEKNKLTVALR